MMYFLARFVGIIALLAVAPRASQPAYAMEAPQKQETISPYAENVMDHISDFLSGISDTGVPSECDAAESRAKAAGNLKSILFDVNASVVGPNGDIERTGCFVADIRALEKYLSDLIDLMLDSAESCDGASEAYYEAAVEYVWGKISALRRYGLSPGVQIPIAADELKEPPEGAAAEDDDARCPYSSLYAPPAPGGGGCDYSNSIVKDEDESVVIHSILKRIGVAGVGGIAFEFRELRNLLYGIWNKTDEYVSSVSVARKPKSVLWAAPFSLMKITDENKGESGCLGWPSDNAEGLLVSGKNVSLHNHYPFVLTEDMAEVFDFLMERNKPKWYEYDRNLAKDAEGSVGRVLYPFDFHEVNRRHLSLESFSILSVRDPQKRMEALANDLHSGTRELVQHVAPFGFFEGTDGADTKLRDFARKYANFLSRMCVNRGCGDILLDAAERTLRDECFSSFLMDRFFRKNPSESTLPECVTRYAN